MSDQLLWPIRFRVSIVPITGAPRSYVAITLLHRDKAVGLAVQKDVRLFDWDRRLYDIIVEELGPTPRDANGTADIDGVDVMDRMEF
jgi:hypothetical protein